MASVDQRVTELSGGNQQKIVAARWMAANPAVIILHEPTQGIDIGAKIDVYELIGSLARQGKAILLVSSELPEVLAMSDRVLSICQSRISGEWESSAATEEKVMAAALGGDR